jgi:hypothetical protein
MVGGQRWSFWAQLGWGRVLSLLVVVLSVLLLSRVQSSVSLNLLLMAFSSHPSVEEVLWVFDVSNVGLLAGVLKVW